jgi:CBS-domain-containing membrane protein
MSEELESLKPVEGAERPQRRKLSLKDELLLLLLPTVTVLAVLALIESLAQQRLLFGSLASSAFLIYLDPEHATNTVRTLIVAHVIAAGAGLTTYLGFGPGYLAAGSAMVITVFVMLLLDAIHPPAIASSLTFAFRAGAEETIILFGLALSLIVVLVIIQRFTVRLLARFTARRS